MKIILIVVAVSALALLISAEGVNFAKEDNSHELVEAPMRLHEGNAYTDGVE